ncbi:MAG TPA: DUF2950 domain-containing protein [Candidatus Paceibacterota bacterium]|nr:DUF2950 domain-containing protein [Verrucomicrobiota bacterium]HRZ47123.1 DUF2950 domain-containing protein [Candidatus Paceibacterota bacterium]HRZ92521.1 DUF2950 domain-containing protein [Candidatus Paceibacterota bacterium]
MKLLSVLLSGLLPVLGAGGPWAARAAETARTFSSAEEAVAALAAAVQAQDRDALRSIFGPAGEEVTNPDRVQAANEFNAFAAALEKAHRLVPQSSSQCVLEVGASAWPFPIPIVRQGSLWQFDTEAGKEELLNRRIGRNELAVLQAMRAYVGAQREYASRDRDRDEVLEYAQCLASAPGTKNGLYWPPDLDGEISPMGPLVAQAQAEGYAIRARGQAGTRAPFHGYYFKILARQGKHAPGGKHDYVVNGNMIAGFALAAWPAEYRQSGVMTFIVNHQGRVYQKDLGPKTARIAAALRDYSPDRTWTISLE